MTFSQLQWITQKKNSTELWTRTQHSSVLSVFGSELYQVVTHPAVQKQKAVIQCYNKKSCPEAIFDFSERFKWGILQMCCGTMFPWTSSMRLHRPLTFSFTSKNQSVVGQLYYVFLVVILSTVRAKCHPGWKHGDWWHKQRLPRRVTLTCQVCALFSYCVTQSWFNPWWTCCSL